MPPPPDRQGLFRRQLGYQRRRVLKGLRLVADHDVVPPAQRRSRELLFRWADRHGYTVAKGMHDPYTVVDLRSFMADTPWKVARDGIKYSTTQLLAAELSELQVAGGIAEVGVCTGDYAQLLSHWFPDRPMLLFDTFEGFDDRDREAELGSGLPPTPYSLPPTTPELVRSRLHRPERAEIRAGWFPETATGLQDERFCFVHVDVGLQAPTRAALDLFWPLLSPGGYLLVADYGNRHAPGARRAVRSFAAENGVGVVPLPDVAATALLAKGGPPP